MKIYTYYEILKSNDSYLNNQGELLKLWLKSWKNNGFDPVVLSLEDAKKSPYYDQFTDQIKALVFKVTGGALSHYGMSCYLRWLAYSTQAEDDSFLVSDYDLINNGFISSQITESKEKISFMDGRCPCLSYGTNNQFLAFCKQIVDCTRKHINEIKDDYVSNKKIRCYHDQDFLILNQKHLSNLNICKKQKYLHSPQIDPDQSKKYKIIHFSHEAVHRVQQNHPKYQDLGIDELRIKLIKELLGI